MSFIRHDLARLKQDMKRTNYSFEGLAYISNLCGGKFFVGKNCAARKIQPQKKPIGPYVEPNYGQNHLAEITTLLPRLEKPKPLASNYLFKPRIATPERGLD